MKSDLESTRRRHGLTLIELLVVISIVLFILAIAIPAIAKTRSAFRRAHCSANLRQLGIAILNYESVFNCMPMQLESMRSPDCPKKYSLHARLLNYIEHENLYNAINFNSPLENPILYGWDSAMQTNYTALTTKVSLFTCPSEANTNSDLTIHGVSYRSNLGSLRYPIAGRKSAQLGPFSYMYQTCTVSDIKDGLSNTIAMSEGYMGRGGMRRTVGGTIVIDRSASRDDGDVSSCNDLLVLDTTPIYNYPGLSWMIGGLSSSIYNHVSPPNSRDVDCLWKANPAIGYVAARSHHPNGVNGMMADGSVRFFSTHIDPALWRAFGTRAGGEAVSP
ncbi:DUF1559 family PulG-like putative transporter [Tautonia rosea]|uniref:DUF1559 family PulG-like putative transporter n=1 Tax=Tautonia rosea TaxID=2728037 RepID=UPI001476592E|nr:DUF1559 domain-containing protein [Tautonia rosea]